MNGKRTRLALKMVVSLALLAYLVYRIGPNRIGEALRGARLGYLLLAFLAICVDNITRAYNWKRLLAARGLPASLRSVFSAFAVGGFFGSFVPSSFGPDGGRTVALARRENLPIETVASSVVMLNLTGLWALSVLFLTGLVGLTAATDTAPTFLSLVAVAAAAVVSVPALLRTRVQVPEPRSDNQLLGWISRFARALASYRGVRRRLPPVFGIAILNQLFAVLVFYLVFRSGGVGIHPLYFAVLVPAVTLARLIPASVAGFGAEQGVVVIAFGRAGVLPAEALAMSLLVSLLNAGFMAGCGLFFAGESAHQLMDEKEEDP